MEIYLEKHIEEFKNKTSHFNYNQNGVFNSEVYILYTLHKSFQSDMFIESGLDSGVSTRKLLELFECPYIGIDINCDCGASTIEKNNFKFICGDSPSIIINQLDENKDKTFSIFIDGPKGDTAINLKNYLLEYENVMFVALHDTYDGLEQEEHLRVFETKSNESYNNKYFHLLNQMESDNLVTIYNLDNTGYEKTYYQTYPNGPGLSVYSKKNINFIL